MTEPTAYPRTSRYYGIEQVVYADAGGQEVPYLKPRLLPRPGDFTTVRMHEVREDDRADVLANRYLGDPEQWWTIADANPVLDPRELTDTPGRRIRITLAEGI